MFSVSRIFSALFPGTVSRCYGCKIKRPSIDSYSLVIICFNCLFPSVRTIHFDAKILLKRVTQPHANLLVPVEGGSIFTKNSTFVFFDGFVWTPRLRSPSPIMAPGATG